MTLMQALAAADPRWLERLLTKGDYRRVDLPAPAAPAAPPATLTSGAGQSAG